MNKSWRFVLRCSLASFLLFFLSTVRLINRTLEENAQRSKSPIDLSSVHLNGSQKDVAASVKKKEKGCTDARVALCLIGTRINGRVKRFRFMDNFMQHVVEPLGGVSNVDLFVNTDQVSLESEDFEEFEKTWPDCRRLAVSFDATVQERPKPPSWCRPLLILGQYILWNNATIVLQRRFSSCYVQIVKQEQRCGRPYEWIFKHRPDAYFANPVFGNGKIINNIDNKKAHFVSATRDYGFNDISFLIPRNIAHLALNLVKPHIPPICISKTQLHSTCRHALGINAVYPECLLNFALRPLWDSKKVASTSLCFPFLARDPRERQRNNDLLEGNENSIQRCARTPNGTLSEYEFCGGHCENSCLEKMLLMSGRPC
mmetsp:Transcript_14508/g.35361  ORF Transcript_14508/g.35361 Transcript_14508/m.35361 type:complete len:372 (-) Transcript_14508:20-1135(-)